jgi:hypothetical protein
MADWFERLFKCFIEFRDCHNWRCGYPEHRGEHWQDETITIHKEHPISLWKLHGHEIAELHKPSYGNAYALMLRDAGYPTITTISRLNGILHYLKKLGITHNVEFRLKFNRNDHVFYPAHTYVVVDGRKFKADKIEMIVDFSERKVLGIYVDEGKEVIYVTENRSLEKIRRAYRLIEPLIKEIEDNIYGLYPRNYSVACKYGSALEEIVDKYKNAVDAIVVNDSTMLGVYARRIAEAWKLIDFVKELRDLLSQIKYERTYAELAE